MILGPETPVNSGSGRGRNLCLVMHYLLENDSVLGATCAT